MRVLAFPVLAILATAATASASLLNVDFGLTSGPVQTGFLGYDLPSTGAANPSQTYSVAGVASGSITITTPGGGVSGRDRGVITGTGTFTYSDLYRSLITALSRGNTATTVTLQISQLDPSTDYSLQIWSNDPGYNNNAVYSWYDTTSGTSAVLLGTITNKQPQTPAYYPNNDAFSITTTVHSNSSGMIKLAQNDSMGNGVINGLVISAVPEPASAAVLGIALLTAGLSRRRSR
jgi:hypothetical protein